MNAPPTMRAIPVQTFRLPLLTSALLWSSIGWADAKETTGSTRSSAIRAVFMFHLLFRGLAITILVKRIGPDKGQV